MDKFYQDSKEQILELINLKNNLPIQITSDNVMLSEASPSSEDNLIEVGVRGVQDGGYRKDPIRVKYSRIDLDKLFGGNFTPEITTLSQANLYKLLPRFNAILGTRFTISDVENIDFIPYDNDIVVNLTIKAKPTSKFYSGEVNVVFNRRWILLEEVIDPYLDLLHHPDPIVEGRTAVGLLTWGMDFTVIRNTMTVDPTAAQFRGAFSNMEAFRTALTENFGIWAWPDNRDSTDPNSRLGDFDTRDVERANRNFQRVVIQSNIRQSDYVGTAYFHYNLS